MGTLSAGLNLSDISSPIPSLPSSLVVHSFVVLLLIGTSTLVGIGFLVWLSSLWMEAHTFFYSFREQLVQLVERKFHDPIVTGLTPVLG